MTSILSHNLSGQEKSLWILNRVGNHPKNNINKIQRWKLWDALRELKVATLATMKYKEQVVTYDNLLQVRSSYEQQLVTSYKIQIASMSIKF